MLTSHSTTLPSHCPLCGQPNQCAMEIERASGIKQPPCWCTDLTFDPAVLDRIPAADRMQACVCRACATGAPASA